MASFTPYQPNFAPTATGNFDPSQWSDPYSSFNAPGAIPGWPTSYQGPPTDAFGNPIPSYGQAQQAAQQAQQQFQQQQAAAPSPAATPGRTINTPPGVPAGQVWNAQGQQQIGPAFALAASQGQPLAGGPNRAQIDAMNAGNAYGAAGAAAGAQGNGWGSRQGAGNAAESAGWGYLAQQAYNQAQAPPPAAAAPAAPAGPPPFNSYDAALTALSNPGQLRQYGATVPTATTTQPSGSVLQNFLQNWKPATSGPGSGFAQNFSKSLRGA